MEEDKELSISERRMAENELYFRKQNEKVVNRIKSHQKTAKEEGVKDIDIEDNNLQFICECSDNDCRKRITMKAKEWTNIHSKDDIFIVYPGHVVDSLEKVIDKKKGYDVVEKFIVPEEPEKLNQVNVSFS